MSFRVHFTGAVALMLSACGGKAAPPDDGAAGGAGTAAASCKDLASNCGPTSSEDCCDSPDVPGGTFFRDYDGVTFTNKSYPATVSDFRLDRFEISVGRFRAFVDAGLGTQASPPAAGDGAHPLIAGSGWDSSWDASLAFDTPTLMAALRCESDEPQYATWTDTAGTGDNLPINCLTWYEAFAFCAWDGGRLPTEAEWYYAAAGGTEQRIYPWGGTVPDANTDLAVYGCYYNGNGTCSDVSNIAPVGSANAGAGRWGQVDLAGNLNEWTLDWYAPQYFDLSCNDCALLTDTTSSLARVIRSSSFWDPVTARLMSAPRFANGPDRRSHLLGARCARSP